MQVANVAIGELNPRLAFEFAAEVEPEVEIKLIWVEARNARGFAPVFGGEHGEARRARLKTESFGGGESFLAPRGGSRVVGCDQAEPIKGVRIEAVQLGGRRVRAATGSRR